MVRGVSGHCKSCLCLCSHAMRHGLSGVGRICYQLAEEMSKRAHPSRCQDELPAIGPRAPAALGQCFGPVPTKAQATLRLRSGGGASLRLRIWMKLRRQVRQVDLLVVAKEHRPFDDMAQLPDISRPAMSLEGLDRPRGDAGDGG